MASYTLTINNKTVQVDAEPDMPLLWVIRDLIGLKGTKFGCGIAQCGACTVHLAGNPVRSCSLPLSVVAGQKITTIEGIDARQAEAVQKACIEDQGPQCSYYPSAPLLSPLPLPNTTPKPPPPPPH